VAARSGVTSPHGRRVPRDENVEGAEIIGFDPAIGSYMTLCFGTDGPAAYEAIFQEEGETLVWEMRDESTRFAGLFSSDADTITGQCELLKGETWLPGWTSR
jgi:hypothetical protein